MRNLNPATDAYSDFPLSSFPSALCGQILINMKTMYWKLLLFVVAVGAAGCGKPAAPTAPPKMPPQEVGVITIAPERVEIFTELPGRTTAFRIAEVRPQVSGIILKRLYEEGSDVKEGQPLYLIDPATYKAAADSAAASVARAEAAVEVSRLNAERRGKLVQSNVISAQDNDDAIAAHKQALADLGTARASLENARINLEYTQVLSPISGRIGRSSVTEGALVTAGQPTAMATIQQLDPIYLDVTQSSTDLLRLRREAERGHIKTADGHQAAVRLVLEDGTEYSETGKIQFSEVSVDEGTGSVTLRAVFPNPKQELLPGMFVRAKVNEGIREDAILLPQKGVTRNAKGEPTALVVGEGNRVEQRVLEVDRTLGDKWIVLSGIRPGDRVILEGLQKTAPGREVKPAEIVK